MTVTVTVYTTCPVSGHKILLCLCPYNRRGQGHYIFGHTYICLFMGAYVCSRSDAFSDWLAVDLLLWHVSE